jgi:energy-converting hydrogenase Eha subunit A
MFGAFSAAGDYGITSTKGFWIGGALAVGYVVSIYLLKSLVDKGRPRRLGSWTFSVAFHGLMLVFGATVLGLGQAVAIFMAPEVVVVALSVVGLILSAGKPRNVETAPTSR